MSFKSIVNKRFQDRKWVRCTARFEGDKNSFHRQSVLSGKRCHAFMVGCEIEGVTRSPWMRLAKFEC